MAAEVAGLAEPSAAGGISTAVLSSAVSMGLQIINRPVNHAPRVTQSIMDRQLINWVQISSPLILCQDSINIRDCLLTCQFSVSVMYNASMFSSQNIFLKQTIFLF